MEFVGKARKTSIPRSEELAGALAPQPERELLGELVTLLAAERGAVPKELLALARAEWPEAN
jgi:hypothetical protein